MRTTALNKQTEKPKTSYSKFSIAEGQLKKFLSLLISSPYSHSGYMMQTNFIITLSKTRQLDRIHKILIFRGLGTESRSSFQDFRSFSQIIKVFKVFAVKGNTQSYWEIPSRVLLFFRHLSLFLDKQNVNLILGFLSEPLELGFPIKYAISCYWRFSLSLDIR